METLEGRASAVKSSVVVSGGQAHWSDDPGEPRSLARVTYVTLFRLGNRAVEMRWHELVQIGEGDPVLLAGQATRRGTFDVLAYRNLSTLAGGDRGFRLPLVAS